LVTTQALPTNSIHLLVNKRRHREGKEDDVLLDRGRRSQDVNSLAPHPAKATPKSWAEIFETNVLRDGAVLQQHRQCHLAQRRDEEQQRSYTRQDPVECP